jgi:hypothetical protein
MIYPYIDYFEVRTKSQVILQLGSTTGEYPLSRWIQAIIVSINAI